MKKTLLSFCMIAVSFVNAQNFGFLKQFEPHSNGGIRNLSVSTNATGEIVNCGIGGNNVDFDPGVSTYSIAVTYLYPTPFWISKLDANGNFLWAKVIEVSGGDSPMAKINSTGEVIIGNSFDSNGTGDFDPGSGTFTMAALPGYLKTGFIEKLSTSGTFVWAKQFEQNATGSDVSINDLELDNVNNIYVTGVFRGSIDFDPSPTTSLVINGGTQENTFIVKLDNNGNFKWVKTFIGNITSGGNVKSIAMVLDKDKNIITSGTFNGTVDFDPSSATFTLNTIQPINRNVPFISKLDSNGNFMWVNQFVDAIPNHNNGTPLSDIDVDSNNDLYITGSIIDSLDFDPGIGTFYLKSSAPYFNVYVVKLTSTGNFQWGKMFKGNFNDSRSSSIKIDNNKDVFVALNFNNNVLDLDPGIGTATVSAFGNTAILVNRLNANGDYVNNYYFISNSNASNSINSMAFDNTNNLLVNGEFSLYYNNGTNWIDFDPGIGLVKGINYFAKSCGFLVKLNNLSVGINEKKIELVSFNIFPNPSSQVLNIEFEMKNKGPVTIDLTNTLGQIVFTERIMDDVSSDSATLNINNLNPGVYFVNATDSKGNKAVKKIIKE